jgi:hypothetical protein
MPEFNIDKHILYYPTLKIQSETDAKDSLKDKVRINVQWMENQEQKEVSSACIVLEHENDVRDEDIEDTLLFSKTNDDKNRSLPCTPIFVRQGKLDY